MNIPDWANWYKTSDGTFNSVVIHYSATKPDDEWNPITMLSKECADMDKKCLIEDVKREIKEARIRNASAQRSKYHREIKPGVWADAYDVFNAWKVPPALQHAIKKLLMPGERGSKGYIQDLDEAIQSIEREKECYKEWE